MADVELTSVQPCLSCGSTDVHFECIRPEGRTQDFWRVVCSCGQTSQQWSMSKGAAVRSWNRNLAHEMGGKDVRRW